MAGTVSLHRDLAHSSLLRAQQATKRIRAERQGGSLSTLLNHVLDRLRRRLLSSDEEFATISGVAEHLQDSYAEALERKYERVLVQLRIVHMTISKYRTSLDRADVPVGLQYLIDTTMHSLTNGEADPIICLDPLHGYSTVSLITEITEISEESAARMEGTDSYRARRPVALNLPADDPNNALLAPLLMHEAAHTAAEMRLETELKEATVEQAEAASEMLRTLGNDVGQAVVAAWESNYRDWSIELLCDAVAIARTGPSFTLAFVGFAQPTAATAVTTHPGARARIAFQLRFLDRLGWTAVLREHIPDMVDWLDSIGDPEPRTKDPQEIFLLNEMAKIEEQTMAVALAEPDTVFRPEQFGPIAVRAIGKLQAGIPAVDNDAGANLTPWQILLAGWVARIRTASDAESDPLDSGSAIVRAISDDGYNALLVKSIELASVVEMWSRYERPGS